MSHTALLTPGLDPLRAGEAMVEEDIYDLPESARAAIRRLVADAPPASLEIRIAITRILMGQESGTVRPTRSI